MCEIKCDDKELDYADRQNMHSCSVTVKALLKLEQKANQYRKNKKFKSLLDKILVYFISHDQNDARVWEHYAMIEERKWTYYRHHIEKFDIAHEERVLLTLYNFARNVLTEYASELLRRLRKAVAALPISSTLSFSADTMNLKNDSQQSSQQLSQDQDAEGFATPVLSASTQKLFDAQKEQIDKLLQQMKQQKEQMERQMNELKKEKDDQREQMKQQRQELTERLIQKKEESKQRHAELMEQNKKLIDMLARGWTKE